MTFARKLFITLKAVADHPLHRGAGLRAALRFCVAQVASRFVPGDICIDFPNGTKLLVAPRMKGAAYFIFPGVYEFSPMSFVVHFLRPGELFVDVGANIGAYTVLGGAVAGADVVTFEPSPSTFANLQRNVRLNDLTGRARVLNMAVGRAPGTMRLTEGLGTENYLSKDQSGQQTTAVSVTTLDHELSDQSPVLMKVDVEGFETEVFAGAQKVLRNSSLQAMIVERNESGLRYGFNEQQLHESIRAAGFVPCDYDPFSRTLRQVSGEELGDIIYVRDVAAATARLKAAAQYRFAQTSV